MFIGKSHWNTGSWNVPEPKQIPAIRLDIFGDAHPPLETLEEPGKAVLM